MSFPSPPLCALFDFRGETPLEPQSDRSTRRPLLESGAGADIQALFIGHAAPIGRRFARRLARRGRCYEDAAKRNQCRDSGGTDPTESTRPQTFLTPQGNVVPDGGGGSVPSLPQRRGPHYPTPGPSPRGSLTKFVRARSFTAERIHLVRFHRQLLTGCTRSGFSCSDFRAPGPAFPPTVPSDRSLRPTSKGRREGTAGAKHRRAAQRRSNRSSSITLVHADTKSRTNFASPSSEA